MIKVLLNRADIECFRTLVSPRLGFQFDDDKLEMLADILCRRMKATGCEQFSAYQKHFTTLVGEHEEMRALAEHLTVCETFFFRYWDHFRAFAELVVPSVLFAQKHGQKLRLLSAGCASGEEAYSLAILIRNMFPNLSSLNVSILGVDVNRSVLEKARRGIYSAWSLRETPEHLLAKYFHQEGQNFRLNDSVRSLVNFEERNLVDADHSFWHEDAFDVVFCRNVAMYFTPEVMRSVISRIGRSLGPGGFLFLGHAETLRGISHDFHLRHTHDTFYYQRRRADEAGGAYTPPRFIAVNGTSSGYPTPVAEATNSWFEVIQRSSERIVSLTSEKNEALRDPAGNRPRQMVNRKPEPPLLALNLTLARELMGKERFGEAMELLRTLPPESKADPDAQLLLAVLLTNAGDLGEAEKICKHLLKLDELNAGAHYLIALCREHAGDYKAAIRHDEAAVYLDSAFAMPHLHRGLVAKRSADIETAKRQLGRAVVLLAREDASRVLLFGGGFTREALTEFCRSELRACGGNA
jgi:chemotaxis protein methyltransferase CheR